MKKAVAGLRQSACMIAIAVTAFGVSSQSARAQAPDAQAGAPSDAASAADESGSQTEAIVVTGSRIPSGFDRPTPVTVLGAARLEERAATNLGDALNELPAFRATQTPASSGLAAAAGYVGGRILDLRGLGSVRTLTLVDGKRFVPSTTQSTVDTNMIPSVLLSRAEVVTGGASAVYGSDAVSGVVNLLIDKTFTGYKANAQMGFAKEGDNFTRQGGAAAGWQFGPDLHLVVGGEWEKSSGIDGCYARSWCQNGLTIVGRNRLATGQVPTVPSSNILPNAYTWSASFNGVTTPPASAYVGRDVPALRPIDGITFNADGTPRRYQFGTLVNSIWQYGGEYDGKVPGPGESIYFDFPIVSPTERATGMGYLTWNATPALTLELGVTYGHGEGRHRTPAYRNTAIVIQNDNPFLPRSNDPTLDIPTVLAASGLTSFTLGKGFEDVGAGQIHVRNNVLRIVGSANYQISPNWKADLYYQYGRNDFRSEVANATITSRMVAALDATSANGVPVCRINVDANTTNNDPACVPLNPFGFASGPNFAAAKAYVTGTAVQTNITTENVVAGNVTGSVVDLPAGPLGVSVGAEYRSDQVAGDTDPLSKVNGFFIGSGSVISGKIEVAEVYGEADVPLLRDTIFAQELGLNGAVRRTHYSRSSALLPSSTVDVTTWKIGGVWAPIDAIRFRVTRSRDIRAPNVSELFGPVTRTTGILTDTGNGGVQVIVPITSGSNANLRPEKADTFTAGVVLQPRGGVLGRFRASVDYYDIKIKDAISTLGQQNIVNRCVAGDALSCSLVTRDSTNTITNITDTVQNVNQLIARGIDFELAYRQPIGADNMLTLDVLASNVRALITVDSVGATDRAGQTGLRGGTPPGLPDWTVDATAKVDLGKIFSVSGHVRWISKGFFFPTFIEPGDPGFTLADPNSVNTNDIPSRTYLDLLTTVKVPTSSSTKLAFFFGIDNVFDKDPPNFPGANGAGNNILFSPVGRMYKFGLRTQF